MPLPSVGILVRELIVDARAWAAAEADVLRIRAGIAGRSAAWIAGFAIAALILAQAAMVGLVVGLLFILAPFMGMAWATVSVTGGAIVLIGLLLWLAKRRVTDFGRKKELER